MKNEDRWVPTRLRHDKQKDTFAAAYNYIYAGSRHIAMLQAVHYVPLIRQYIRGDILDCGCGTVPYYEVYKSGATSIWCVDKPVVSGRIDHIDQHIDLNADIDLGDRLFHSIMFTDVIAHVMYPAKVIKSLAAHLHQHGHIFITTPFVYWISEYPDEYFHPTDTALRMMCLDAGLEVIHLEPYGGYADTLLDTLNKGMTSRISGRLFRLLASVVKKTSWYRKSNEKTLYSYPLGYTLVARKS